MAEQDMEITLGDDVVTVDAGAPLVTEETPAQRRQRERGGAPRDDTPDAGIEELRRALAEKDQEAERLRAQAEAERHARIQAEQAQQEAATRAHESGEAARVAAIEANQRSLDSVQNALAAAQGEQKSLESALAAAFEKGEYGAAAQMQTRLGMVAAQIVNFEAARAGLQDQVKADGQSKPAERTAPQFNQTQQQKIDQWLATNVSAKTADWLRAHPMYFTDQDFQGRVTAAHMKLTKLDGVPQDTPEYFRQLEELTGLRAPEAPPVVTSRAADTTPRAAAKPPAAPPVPAAPVSRSPQAGPTPAKGTRITLSLEQQDIARQLFPKEPDPYKVYARNLLALEDPAERAKFTRTDH